MLWLASLRLSASSLVKKSGCSRRDYTTDAVCRGTPHGCPLFLEAKEADLVPSEASLKEAITQSFDSKVRRMQLQVTATGLDPAIIAYMGTDTEEPVSLLDINGAFNHDDWHLVVGGLMPVFFGFDGEKGLELMTSDGQNYIRGPIGLLGLTEERWYVSSEDVSDIVPVTTDPDELLNNFDDQDFDQFVAMLATGQTSRVMLEGLQCTLYTLDAEAMTDFIEELNTEQDDPLLEPDEIQDVELKVWVCDDGYFHQAEVVGLVRPEDDTSGFISEQGLQLGVLMRLYDFDQDIAITAPTDALPLESPTSGMSFFSDLEDSEGSDWLNQEDLEHMADEPSDAAATADEPSDAAATTDTPFFAETETTAEVAVPPPAEHNTPGSSGTATVFNGGNIRDLPTLQGAVLGQLRAGQSVTLHRRTANSLWYEVTAPAGAGWVHASLLTIDPSVAARIVITEQQGIPILAAEELRAMVFNGGNVRAEPSLRGSVLDQIHAGETLQLRARNVAGTWYQITNPRGTTGWVHVSLLRIDPNVAMQTPLF